MAVVGKMLMYASMISMIAVGAFLLYEGATYIKMKEQNPEITDLIYAAVVFAFLVGIMDIVFGIAHFWFLGG